MFVYFLLALDDGTDEVVALVVELVFYFIDEFAEEFAGGNEAAVERREFVVFYQVANAFFEGVLGNVLVLVEIFERKILDVVDCLAVFVGF